MTTRFDPAQVAPGIYAAMMGLERYLHACGLEPGLVHLIKLRASQLNGCAYCLDMHWKDLRALGETEQRLYSLDARREWSCYTPIAARTTPGRYQPVPAGRPVTAP